VNFGVLNNKWNNWSDAAKEIIQDIENIAVNGAPTEFPIYTNEEFAAVKLILDDVLKSMGIFFTAFDNHCCEIMESHAPDSMHDQIKTIVRQTSTFTITGYLGAIGLKSGVLEMPEKDQKAAVTGFIL
jgi:transcription elongation factor GreA-like protein